MPTYHRDDTNSMLAELRAISNRSATSRFLEDTKFLAQGRRCRRGRVNDKENKTALCNAAGGDRPNVDAFLQSNPENFSMNQYWYSKLTIKTLNKAVFEMLEKTGGDRVAFLSTPSLYFALPESDRKACKVFDYDDQWSNDPGFVRYDFNNPEAIDSNLKGSFDVVVIDPPFITKDVWEKYSVTAKALLRHCPLANDTKKRGLVLATTIAENASLMMDLFGAEASMYRPKVPNLVYQYNVYVNCLRDCTTLVEPNAELQDD